MLLRIVEKISMLWRAIRIPKETTKKTDSQPILEELEPRQLFSGGVEGVLLADPIPEAPVYLDISNESDPDSVLVADSQAPESEPATERQELVFIDTDVTDYQQLLNNIVAQDSAERNIKVVVLDNQRDGIEQIGEVLAGYQDLDAVHLIAHGNEGNINLGNTLLNFRSLYENSSAFEAWSDSFSEDGDLLVYGCNLAASQEGQRLVDALSQLTAADVAASDDLTGHASLDGDWDLEYAVGEVETSIAVSAATQGEWIGTLDIDTGLVAHYDFEEGGGATANDVAAADVVADDGSLQGTAAPTYIAGPIGSYALDFSAGSNDKVVVSDSADLDLGSGDFTVSAWFKTGAVSGTERILGKATSGGSGFVIFNDAVGDTNLYVSDGTNSVTIWGSGYQDDNWHQVTAVRNGSNFELYIDNVLVDSATQTMGSIDNNEDLLMGISTGDTSAYGGQLDEVRLYDRALSAADRTELYNYTGATSPAVDLDANDSSASGINFTNTWTEGGGAVSIADTDAVLSDSDSTHLTSLTVSITNLWDGANEILSANTSATSISANYNSSTGVLSLSGTDTLANYQQVLRTITYNNTHDYPVGQARSIEFVASDGTNNSLTAITTLNMATDQNVLVVTNNSDSIGGDTSSIAALLSNDGGDGISLREAIIASNNTVNSSNPDVIRFDLAGSGPHIINVTSALPTITEATIIDGTHQEGWVAGSNLPIVLDGNDGVYNGLQFATGSDNSEVRGLVIRDFGSNAIQIDAGVSGVTVAGNWLGRYSSDGTIVAGEDNAGAGIRVLGNNNTIGGTTVADRNVIHDYNYVGGVALDGASAINNVITGNFFGTTIDGNSAVEGAGNYAGYGVFSYNGANSNTIGGATDNHRNIFGGLWEGVGLYHEDGDNNIVQNNWFGLGADGSSIIYTEVAGVRIDDADNTQILDNVFVGASNGDGVRIDSGTDGTIIQGNYFGTDETQTVIAGNWEGVDITLGGTNITIGGINAGQGNVFANHRDNVIEVGNFASGVSIRGNSMYNNAGLGIDLGDNGLTANDAGDADTGANNLQNWAVLTSVGIADNGTLSYDLDASTLSAGSYTVDFYASTDRNGGQVEGRRYIGTAFAVGGGGNWSGAFSPVTLNPGEFVTTVTTDASGNSSEFSNYAVAVDSDAGGTVPADIQVNSTTGGGLSINTDGGNDTYLVADDGGAILGGLTSFTFETRIKLDGVSNQETLVSYYAVNDEFRIQLDSSGDLQLRIATGAAVNATAIDYAAALADNEQHTLSLTWDNSGATNIYIDGRLIETLAGVGTGGTIASNGVLVFGQEQDSQKGGFSTTQTFNGTLYDARIFNDVRSANEIEINYNSDLPYNEANMVANWQFIDLSADGVVTNAVSGNNLTVQHTGQAGFTSSVASLTYAVNEYAIDGTVVGSVSGVDAERDALIASLLAADPNLVYSAETNKFYKVFSGSFEWATAKTNAESTNLNGAGGQLAVIRSASENVFITNLASATGGSVWLGGTDQTVEGEWRWIESGSESDQFWSGVADGHSTNGAYSNWFSSQPNDLGGAEDAIRLDSSSGLWYDAPITGSNHNYVIEWSADDVLDQTQALAYSIQSQTVAGAFGINGDTGQITVVDGNLLDYESNASHALNIRVTDVDGNTFDKTFTVSLNNSVQENTAPTDLSSGIEINTDGGNDAYLISSSGLSTSLTSTTVEITFAANDSPTETVFMSFTNSSTNDELSLQINDPANSLEIDFGGGAALTVNAIDYRATLVDGSMHSLAVSWDSTNGDWAVYIDGQFIESGTGFNQGTVLDTTNGQFVFGQEQDDLDSGYDSTQYFSGTYYDARIWNQVRSAEEISLNYQHKFDTGNLPTGLIANWQMDGFNGSNEVVDVVSGNNLSIAHAAGAGFTTSTPVEDLHINERATNGTSVGFVVPSETNIPNDLVSDGGFLKGDNGTWQPYNTGEMIGDWTVIEGRVDHTSQLPSPLGGVGLELERGVGDAGGTIGQTITTEVGKQYQVIFAATGNFSGGDAVKHLRASVGGVSHDYAIEDTGVYETYSFTFTATETNTDVLFQGLRDTGYGAVISDVQVVEIPAAVSTILNNDASLTYDAATSKFYRVVASGMNFEAAKTNAAASQVNGVGGQLATIRSQYEDRLIHDLIRDTGQNYYYLGGTDATTDGQWNWIEDGVEADRFWISGAGAAPGAYVDPEFHLTGGSEHALIMYASSGNWTDLWQGNPEGSVIEWDASEVLSNFTFSLTDDAGGRFAIDQNTGEITVADGSLLDYESNTSHNVTVEVTDAGGLSYSESMAIQIDNALDPNQTLPGAQTVDEDQVLTFSTGNGNAISVTDSFSATDSSLQVTLSVNDGVLNLSQTTGIIFVQGSQGSGSFVIEGSESALNAAFEGMKYTPNSDFSGAVILNMQTALAANLEGHYTFAGGNANDQSVGTAQDGSFVGGAATTTDGDRGAVLQLNSAGEYVRIDNLYANPNDVTLAAWVNFTSVATNGGEIISLGNDVALRINDTSAGVSGFFWDGSTHQFIGSNTNLDPNGWHHVAFTFDDANDIQTLYIDGEVVATGNFSSSITYTGWFPQTTIGTHADLTDTNFDLQGLIDDARVYTRALSAAEIEALSSDLTTTSNDTVNITVNSVNDAPTFSVGDGLVTTFGSTNGYYTKDLIVQGDGKYVVVGISNDGANNMVSVSRFNEDGSLDTGFGTNGRATTSLGTSDTVYAGTIQADGKILVAGATNAGSPIESAVWRFNADGSIDTSFGAGGAVTMEFSGTSSEYLKDVVVQPDGKIIVAGYANAGDEVMTIARLNTDGSLDSSFNGGSLLTLDIGTGNDDAAAIAIQDDGKIILAGSTGSSSASNFAIVRLNQDGTLDNGFATAGVFSHDVNSEFDGLTSVAIDDQGRIVASGTSRVGAASSESVVLRLDADGNFDTSFNATGIHVMSLGFPHESLDDMALQDDGKIVLTGTSYASVGINDVSVVRLNADGSFDTSFAGDGTIKQAIGTATDSGDAVAIDRSGNILVTGRADGTSEGSHLLRFTSSGELDASTTFSQTLTLDNNPTFVEDGSPVVLDSDVAIYDAELSAADNFNGATLTLARNGGANGDDVFSATGLLSTLTEGGNLVFNSVTVGAVTTNNAGTLVLTFNSSATNALVNRVMQAIAYANSSDNPPSTAQIDWILNDGNAGPQGSGGAQQAYGSTTVNITAVNDDPLFDLDSDNSSGGATGNHIAYFTEGNAPVAVIDADISITDVDNTTISSVSMIGEFNGSTEIGEEIYAIGGEQFVIGTARNTTVTVGGTTFELDFDGAALDINVNSGSGAISDAESLLATMTYEHTGENPTAGARSFSFIAVDGDGGTSNAVTSMISVSAVNDEQVLATNTGATVAEGSAGNVVSTAMLATTDADNTDAQLVYTLDALPLHGALYNNGTALGVNDTFTQADIDANLITYDHDGSQTSADGFDFTVDDGAGSTTSGTFNFTVTNVNDAPVNTVPGAQVVNEDSTLNITGISVNDADGNLATTRLTVSNGTLNVNLAGGASISAGANDSNTLTLSGTQTQINAALASLSYLGNLNFNGSDTLNVLSTESDGTPLSDSDNVAITINAVNDAAVITSIEGANLVYTENDGAVAVTSNIVLNDVDDTNLESALIQINGSYVNGEDLLSFSDQNGISGSWNALTGTLTLSGTSSVSNYESAIRSITYTNQSEDPSTAPRTVSFTVNDGVVDSNTPTRNITVAAVNDAPVLTTNPGGGTYFENSSPNHVDFGAAVTDADSANFDGGVLTVSITNNGTADDRLVMIHEGTGAGELEVSGVNLLIDSVVVASFAGGHGVGDPLVVTFSSQADAAAVTKVTQYVGYENVSNDPSGLQRQMTMQITDGDGGTSANGVRVMNVVPVNDEQVLATNTGATVAEGSAGNVVSTAMLATTDADNTDAQLVYTVDSIPANGTLYNNGVALNIGDTFTQADIDANLITYDHDGSQTSADSFDFTVDDGQGATTSSTFNWTVTNVNDAPVNTVPGAQLVNEDTALNITGISVDDPDGNLATTQLTVSNGTLNVNLAGGATISAGANGSNTLTLSGTQTQINTALATLSYQGNLNFHGSDTLNVLSTDSDGTPLSDSDNVAITVNQINDPGVFGGNLSATTNEDVATAGTVTFTDSADGYTANNFTINTNATNGTAAIDSNGNWTYTPNADFNGSDSFIVEVTDDDGNVETQTISITITAVNDEQVLTTNTGATVAEGSTGNVVTTAMLHTTDVDNTDAQLVYTVDSIPANGTLYNNGVALNIGDTFTQADIDANLITYDHDSSQTSADSFDFTVDDGQGATTSSTFNWTVTNVNDAPVNTVPGAQVVNEDSTLNITGISVNEADGNLATTRLTVSNGTLNVNLAGGASISAGANDSNTLTLSGTQTQINAALASLSYLGNLNFNGSDTLNVLSTDSDGTPLSDSDNVAITINAINDSPQNTAPITVTTNEDTAVNFTGANQIQISDVDHSGSNVRVQLNVGVGGLMTLGDSTGLSFSAGDGVNDANMVFSGTLNDINTALLTLSFTPAADFNGSVNMTVITNDLGNTGADPGLSGDGSSEQDSDTFSIAVNAVNDTAVASSIESSDLAYTENDGAVAITSTLTLSDIDDTHLEAAVIQITGNYFSGEDILSFTDQNGISGSWNAVTGTLTLTGTSTVANYEAALRSITYSNNSEDPSTATRTISFTVNDGDTASNTQNRDVAIAAVNDTAVIAAIDSTNLGYNENDGAVTITSVLTLSDVDDTHLESAVVQIAGNYVNGEDELNFTDQNGISGSWNAVTGTLTLSGTSSVANYQSAIRSVTYTNSSEDPNTATRTVSFTVNDGDSDSNTQTRDIAITKVNDEQILVTNTGALVNEGSSGNTITTAMLHSTDVDNTDAQLVYTVVATPGHGTLYNNGVVIGLNDTFTQAEIDANLITFDHDGSETATDSFNFSVDDGTGATTAGSFNFTVTPVNDPPLATNDSAVVAEGNTQNIDLVDNDTDADNAIDLTSIQIVSGPANGSVSVNLDGTVDYTHDGSETIADSFTYSIRDISGQVSNVATVNLTITPINDAPVATNLNTPETYTEESPLKLAAIVVSDVDNANTTVTLTLSDPVAGSLSTATSGAVTSTYNAVLGVWNATGAIADVNALLADLSFSPSLNYNSSFSISTRVDDGLAAPVTGVKIITGIAVNDAPVATNLNAAEVYTEDTPLNLTDIVVSDADNTNTTVVLALSDISAGSLSTATSGAVTSTFFGGVWTASGAITDVNALLAGLVFTPSSNYNSDFTIVTSVDDGIATPVTGNKTMTGIAANDAPTVIVPAFQNLNEDTPLIFSSGGGNAIVVGDVDAGLSAVEVILSAPNGSISLSGQAGLTIMAGGDGTSTITFTGSLADINAALDGLTYLPQQNYYGYAPLQIDVNDLGNTGGSFLTGSAIASINVIAVNDAPVANPDRAVMNAGTGEHRIAVLSNDMDFDGDPLTVIRASAANGNVLVTSDGLLSYTANANFNGIDTITYDVSDGNGGVATTTVEVTVLAVTGNPLGDPALSPGITPDPDFDDTGLGLTKPQRIAPVLPVAQAEPSAIKPLQVVKRASLDEILQEYQGSEEFQLPVIEIDRTGSQERTVIKFGIETITPNQFAEAVQQEELTLIPENSELWGQLDQMKKQMSLDLADNQTALTVVAGTTVTFTAGFVSWILRSGSLMASFLSSVPLFKKFDPLPILNANQKKVIKGDPDQDDETDNPENKAVERMFED